jgi:hypothetical protein
MSAEGMASVERDFGSLMGTAHGQDSRVTWRTFNLALDTQRDALDPAAGVLRASSHDDVFRRNSLISCRIVQTRATSLIRLHSWMR